MNILQNGKARWLLAFFSVVFIWAVLAQSASAKTVSYELLIDKGQVNKTGALVAGMTINGGTPGPVLTAVEGDVFKVRVINKMDIQTSIHWHGLLLPNDQDGVPYLTTSPLPPRSHLDFEFPIIQSGTYWYHSHTGLQEQRGVYGAIVLHPKSNMQHQMKMSPLEEVLVLSDWSDEDPKQIMRNLKKDGDYYARKKGAVQSWAGVLANGPQAIKNRLNGAWSRMGPMDLSDVGYDAFLVNGQRSVSYPQFKKGDMVKLRLVNAAASSYFNVEYAGGDMMIVAADGIDVEPVSVKRLRIAIAETFDVMVRVPQNMSYEVRASSEDGTGFGSAWLGSGHKMPAPDIPRPNLYLQSHTGMGHGSMDHNSMEKGEHDQAKMNHANMAEKSMPVMKTPAMKMPEMNMSKMKVKAEGGAMPSHHGSMGRMKMGQPVSLKRHDMSDHNAHDMSGHMAMPPKASRAATKTTQKVIAHFTDYQALRSPVPTVLPLGNIRTVNLSLTGNMERYVWSFNNQTLAKADKILIKKGEVVRFDLKNETMMHHPVHLHGHFFRVLNGQGDYAPLKHTVNVPPMGEVSIEFEANTEKDWFFHCHNLYHMMSGMARVVSYEGSSQYTDQVRRAISHDPWYIKGDVVAASMIGYGEVSLSKSEIAINGEFDYNYRRDFDVQIDAQKFLTRFTSIYAGVRVEGEQSAFGVGEAQTHGVIGFRTVLPLLIEADAQINEDGHVEVEIGSSLALTKGIGLMWEASSDEEARIHLEYRMGNQVSAIIGWDSEQGFGAGLGLRF